VEEWNEEGKELGIARNLKGEIMGLARKKKE